MDRLQSGFPGSRDFATNLLVPITNLWKYNQQGHRSRQHLAECRLQRRLVALGRACYTYNHVLSLPKHTQLSLTSPRAGLSPGISAAVVFTGGLSNLQLNLLRSADDGAVFYSTGEIIG